MARIQAYVCSLLSNGLRVHTTAQARVLTTMKVVVTGGSGKVGRAVLRELLEHGHEALNVDRHPPDPARPPTGAPFLPADLTDYGQTLEALSGAETMSGVEAVVHLAAIPSPVHATPDVVFATNIRSTHTVFSAAMRLGLARVVWASSETTLGTPFSHPARIHAGGRAPPAAPGVLLRALEGPRRGDGAPVRPLERHPVHRAALLERDGAGRLHAFPSFWDDPHMRKWNLWSYVDESHAAQSVRLALSAQATGAQAFIIAAADTVMRRPSRELMAEVFPGVPVGDHVAEHGTLLGIEDARRGLGYEPTFSWRELF